MAFAAAGADLSALEEDVSSLSPLPPANHATAPTASAANSASRSWPRFIQRNLTGSG